MLSRVRLVSVGVLLTLAVGCAGASTANDDLEIDDLGSSESSLASPDPTGNDTTGEDGAETGGEVGDEDCNDGDHRGHGKHHRHKFSALDKLDGTRDRNITIASLPAGLPERIFAKLAKIDADHDGIVTKAEVKAFRKARKHGDKRGRRPDREDQDGPGPDGQQ